MRKNASVILLVSLILGLLSSATATKAATIDELLVPYRAVIDKLNEELGSTMYIPHENKEKIDNNIKNMTPDELGALLRQEYKSSNPAVSIDAVTYLLLPGGVRSAFISSTIFS